MARVSETLTEIAAFQLKHGGHLPLYHSSDDALRQRYDRIKADVGNASVIEGIELKAQSATVDASVRAPWSGPKRQRVGRCIDVLERRLVLRDIGTARRGCMEWSHLSWRPAITVAKHNSTFKQLAKNK